MLSGVHPVRHITALPGAVVYQGVLVTSGGSECKLEAKCLVVAATAVSGELTLQPPGDASMRRAVGLPVFRTLANHAVETSLVS